MGIQPDVIVCRTEHPLEPGLKDKIALFCNVPASHVLQNLDVETLYEAPLAMEKEHLADVICECLQLDCPEPDITEWENMVNTIKNLEKDVTVALVGKYTSLHDAYISVVESLKHGGLAHKSNVNIKWIPSEDLNEGNVDELLSDVSGVLVPGGFGDRGIDGKIIAIKYAREHKIPFLGLCLGMQLAIVEFARNVVGFNDAHSIELDPQTTHPVIHLMPEQDGIEDIGGTLRLGSYPCVLDKSSKAYELYGEDMIHERHRHRYEVNNYYREDLLKAGMTFSGLSPDGRIVEMMELKDHPWFMLRRHILSLSPDRTDRIHCSRDLSVPLWNTRTHINNQTNNQLVNKRAKPAFCPPRIASQFSLAFHHVTSIFLYQNKPANPLRKSGFAGLLYESFGIQKALHSVTNKVQCFFT